MNDLTNIKYFALEKIRTFSFYNCIFRNFIGKVYFIDIVNLAKKNAFTTRRPSGTEKFN